MARLNLTAPCDSCAASTEALSILGTSLHTAVEGNNLVTHQSCYYTDLVMKRPNISASHFHVRSSMVMLSISLTMFTEIPPPLSHVASEHIPQELKEVCARHGYYIAEGMYIPCLPQ